MKSTEVLEKIKKTKINIKLKVMAVVALVFSLTRTTTVIASESDNVGDPTKINEALEKLSPLILDAVRPISAILVFLAVIILGINIIIKRNKPDERTGAMLGLLTVGIGCFILGSAGMIFTFIMSLAE